MSSSWNVDAYRSVSLSECHWKLCREFMTRYRHLYPEEQTVALAQIFANAQLLLRGDADQTTRLVLDLAREQPSAEVKLEVDGIEKGLVKREEVSSEDVPEVAVERELGSVVVKTEQSNESERDDNAELSSTHEDSTVESSTIGPPSAKQRKTDQGELETDATTTILAGLIPFKPVKKLQNIEDVYRNLVIVDNDFEKTCREFQRLQSGSIQSVQQTWDEGHCSSKIFVDQIVLVEGWSKTESLAKKKALAAFFKKMKVFCYQIVSKKPSHLLENQIARTEDPTTNSKHYKSIMKRFVKDSIEHELVFSEEFSKAERDKLQRIATKLDLETCIVKSSTNPQLKIIGQPLPALAIVERIVVQKDPELGALYEVIAPSVGARVEVADST
ncbi:uncharacterized protein LOC120431952 [Culex pipiens pallens]|uniref:uncharacterized protein LOC120431952 n=1 Tax=Culex pipiens pallens TaxID=42434 RepID=UPI001953886D|nr:uncharacterized protein LOC120431952 [Culex pipiens pallens]